MTTENGVLDARAIRRDFPILQREINGHPLVYLDSAATSQKPRQVIDAVSDFYSNHNANAHRGIYTLGEEATEAFEGARAKLAAFFDSPDPRTIVFTRGTTESMNLVAQALAQQWKKVGVTLEITSRANANQYFSEAFDPKYPAFMTIFGQQPIWTEGPSLFLPSALFNPFRTADPKLQSLYDQAAEATGTNKDEADRKVKAYLVQQAWFVPVVTTGLPYYTSSKVTGAKVSPKAPLASIYEVQPAA